MWTIFKTGLKVVGLVGLAVSIHHAFKSSENTKAVVVGMDQCVMASYTRHDLAGAERCLRDFQKASHDEVMAWTEVWAKLSMRAR